MGRLTRDPEVRYTQGNEPMAIARYTLAVDRRGKKRRRRSDCRLYPVRCL
ncbi:MAG: single-stranded DNA-binding protein [Alistipes putredinis]